MNFEMNVRAGGATGASHSTNELTLLDHVTRGDEQLIVMAITRDVAGAMIDFDHAAVAVTLVPGERDDT